MIFKSTLALELRKFPCLWTVSSRRMILVLSVSNPNFFTVTFKSIQVSVAYPINNTQIGGGKEDNVVFRSNARTTFTFPFTFEYSQAADPNGKILEDIATKCGFVPGSAKKQLTIDYTLTVCPHSGLGVTVVDLLCYSLPFKYCS